MKDIEKGEMINIKDWKKAARTPATYRIGKTSPRNQIFYLILGLILFLVLLHVFRSSEEDDFYSNIAQQNEKNMYRTIQKPYNSTYPMTLPKMVHNKVQFKIAVVTDLDHSSRSKVESNTWVSYYMHGTLLWDPATMTVSVTWDKQNFRTLKTTFSQSGRGMELSELVTFDGRLISFDDRSGLVYVIEEQTTYPWILLTDGDGKLSKGFKSEWATVKDEHLYVGSMGKEWTTATGDFVNHNPMWVKKISRTGEVTHVNWHNNYLALRSSLGIHFPGYILHESALWSQIHRKWFFLPRRLSRESYNEEADELMGTNILMIADEDFKNIQTIQVGEVIPAHGFASFKFIPGTKDEVIVALKTSEVKGKLETHIMVFTINGKLLLGETKIDNLKYEGFEFI